MKKLLAEAMGTCALVFCGTGAIALNEVTGWLGGFGIAVVFGAVVYAMIRAVGSISGAHLNPAVTIGTCIAGRLQWRNALPYVLAQIIGAVVASWLVRALFPGSVLLGATMPSAGEWPSFGIEVFMSFLLMAVILAMSSAPSRIAVYAALAIGTTVFLEAWLGGPFTGASMNPARSIGPALVSGQLDELWIYVLAPTVGMITAAALWTSAIRTERTAT